MKAGSIGATQNGAEVLRIFDAVQYAIQRRLIQFLGNRQQVVQCNVFLGCYVGDNALAGRGKTEAADDAFIHKLHRRTFGFSEIKDFGDDTMPLDIISQQYFINGTPGFKQFQNRISTFDDV